MIVTIDGPAGTGKSTVARGLAERLGFAFLNTGAMYRGVALACLRGGFDPSDEPSVGRLLSALVLSFSQDRLLLDGEDVADQIRDVSVTDAASLVAALPSVRQALVLQQQRIGEGTDLVTEGRDQGTVVFPHAECKFFLTASPEVRAVRRVEEMRRKGIAAEVEDILSQQQLRDQRDESRAHGPLRPAEDAITINTSAVSASDVLDHLEAVVRSRLLQRQ
jgi:cytidylate kinase